MKNEIKEVEENIFKLAEEIASIKHQLATAGAIARETGDSPDNDWYLRASYALKMRGIEHQRSQCKLGHLKKEEQRELDATKERKFIDAARRVLDKDTYKALWQEVNLVGKG